MLRGKFASWGEKWCKVDANLLKCCQLLSQKTKTNPVILKLTENHTKLTSSSLFHQRAWECEYRSDSIFYDWFPIVLVWKMKMKRFHSFVLEFFPNRILFICSNSFFPVFIFQMISIRSSFALTLKFPTEKFQSGKIQFKSFLPWERNKNWKILISFRSAVSFVPNPSLQHTDILS